MAARSGDSGAPIQVPAQDDAPRNHCPCGCGAYGMPGSTVICADVMRRCIKRLPAATLKVFATANPGTMEWQEAWRRVVRVATDRRGKPL